MRFATQLQQITDTRSSQGRTATAGPGQSFDRAVVRELDQTAAKIVTQASNAGVDIEYLGVEPLRGHAELYAGDTPWVVCPARLDPLMHAGMPIPTKQRATLDQLVHAGMNFPHLYFAHEVPKNLTLPTGAVDGDGKVKLKDADIARLVVRPDMPAKTRKTTERLETATRLAARGAARVGAAAAMVAAAPLLLLDGLDPAVLGAITRPQDRDQPAPPAAFFLLAHWDW